MSSCQVGLRSRDGIFHARLHSQPSLRPACSSRRIAPRSSQVLPLYLRKGWPLVGGPEVAKSL